MTLLATEKKEIHSVVFFAFINGVKDGYTIYDNGDGVTAQAVYYENKGTITVLFINYGAKNVDMTLKRWG